MKILILIGTVIAVIGGGVFLAKFLGTRDPQTKVVALTEATASVTKEVRKEGLTAIENSVDLLSRGDEIVVMPITSDAANDVQGRTIRHLMPKKRMAFDLDISEAKEKLRKQFDTFDSQLAGVEFDRSDILGTLRLAAEERPSAADDRFVILIISDFIEDSRWQNFNVSPHLADVESAKKLAASVAAEMTGQFAGAEVFLGQIRSEDLRKLKESRREAIRAFWAELLIAAGAKEVVWATDGVGGLTAFIRQRQRGGEKE